MRDLLFQLGFSLLLVHELDAITQHEWRLLFVLRNLHEPLARDLFVVLHVPIVATLLWLIQHSSPSIQKRTKIGMASFLLVHAWMHWNLRNHPLNTFTSSISLSLIYGAGALGLIYLLWGSEIVSRFLLRRRSASAK